jgi:hypothetical protein
MRATFLLTTIVALSVTLACSSDGDGDPAPATATVVRTLNLTPSVQAQRPIFDGEINGFRFYDFDGASKDVEYPNIWCNAARTEQVEVFRLEYIPPSVPIPSNHSADDQTMRWCVDGSPAFVSQRYAGGPGSWTVTYYFLEKAIPSLWTADRVSATTVQGKAAVVVAPATPDGTGGSVVAFDFADGWVVIEASDMPLDETLKIAEGIRLVSDA